MQPIIRNTFIRLIAFVERVLRGLITALQKTFVFFSKLFGLSTPSYYFEDKAQEDEPAESATTSVASNAVNLRPNRRRSESEMDYFRNMARQIDKPN
ncbi:hypothetical protein H6G00_11140 [Leptolyngbya sp. FACHB-541]|uniref:hypothetical protein n=1 Tax=Leptolyngbya sp. FACHB-541 TaxID=2692810 RepID=UPI00168A090A|nr:hypothetical protein [Leptolyngbya sp. FACHB-541]MBD1997173.1 hypothetical protein [Leptolyngbya sp. FACHB-541]